MREKLTNYIRAGYPGVCLVTHGETRAEAELKAVTAIAGLTDNTPSAPALCHAYGPPCRPQSRLREFRGFRFSLSFL